MKNENIINDMKKRVYEANCQLPKWGLVKLTWGNVSEINRELGVIVIKPSGVPYDLMNFNQMVVTDLEGNLKDPNSLQASSDLPTHIILYKEFEKVNSIVHTHSTNAVIWAQSGRSLPVYGTTHADTFYGEVSNTRHLSLEEVNLDYEKNTGKVIVETFVEKKLNPLAVPGVLVNGHGPFTWGSTTQEAIENSYILEEISKMSILTEQLCLDNVELPNYIVDKHYFRKHGKKAYYGQKLK